MPKKSAFEAQLTRLSLISSLPLLVLLLWMMIYADVSVWLILLTGFAGSLSVAYTHYRIHQKSAYQFRSLSNLLDAMTQGDYSLRGRSDNNHSALGELIDAINGLAQRLSQQRWESVESQQLVRTVIEHIDVAIIALSEQNRIKFLNPAAKQLLQLDRTETDAELLKQLAFVHSFSSGQHQIVELALGHQHGRFNVHVETFREGGMQQKLLFITDVRTLLRREERKAWQSLVRVISHEINNSLTPIASISQTLKRLVNREGSSGPYYSELTEGLTLITERANGLSRFVESYKQLARLPDPQPEATAIQCLVEKVIALFKDPPIVIEADSDVRLFIDPIQFEQVLINLTKNAMEAMTNHEADGSITINWYITERLFVLTIKDEGTGISNPDNLFVPFYSTKKQGSGIGLVLSRQIIEAHNGRLTVSNRTDAPGCCARIEVPLSEAQ